MAESQPEGYIMKQKELAGMMDHTLLKATATPAQIEKLCKEALEIG